MQDEILTTCESDLRIFFFFFFSCQVAELVGKKQMKNTSVTHHVYCTLFIYVFVVGLRACLLIWVQSDTCAL